jgi:hypothetical protein
LYANQHVEFLLPHVSDNHLDGALRAACQHPISVPCLSFSVCAPSLFGAHAFRTRSWDCP